MSSTTAKKQAKDALINLLTAHSKEDQMIIMSYLFTVIGASLLATLGDTVFNMHIEEIEKAVAEVYPHGAERSGEPRKSPELEERNIIGGSWSDPDDDSNEGTFH